jgi:hypothetical protein
VVQTPARPGYGLAPIAELSTIDEDWHRTFSIGYVLFLVNIPHRLAGVGLTGGQPIPVTARPVVKYDECVFADLMPAGALLTGRCEPIRSGSRMNGVTLYLTRWGVAHQVHAC